jgi:Ca-activated chloride channel homolog
MSTLHDDPRLTAYALGELSPSDQAAFERRLASSAEAPAEFAAIREMAEQLRSALKTEPALPLTDFVAPAWLVASASGKKEASLRHRWISKVAVAVSCLALLGTFSWVAWSGRNSPRNAAATRVAMSERQRLFTLNSESDVDSDGVLDSRRTDLDDGTISEQPEPSQYVPLFAFRVMDDVLVGPPPGSPNAASTPYYGVGGYVPPQDSRRSKRNANVATKGPTSVSVTASAPVDDFILGGKVNGVAAGDIKTFEIRAAPRREAELKLQRADRVDRPLRPDSGKRIEELMEVEKLSKERDLAVAAEDYAKLNDNPYFSPLQQPLSTFSIDVDTAAYSNMRRFLTQGNWPPPDSVRIEELVNYFTYDYTPPGAEIRNPKSEVRNEADAPFAVHMEVAACPWNTEHRLVRVGLKGKEIALDKRPVSNIVFLIDVSGSMQPANKLPLVKAGLRGLVEQFTDNDRVGIVVYAGASGLVLDSTNATQKDLILSAIENLQAGGSTNGGEGIQLAYALARKHFINKGTNRVILCTDGDFNVGITNQDDLTRLIEEESKSGVFLSVLGFGMGNLKDSTLEKLADKGNGNYAYIDTLKEANKVFVEQMTGTLITIAKDVKIQIEFNPSQVGAYRLIGYENRLLAAQDFRDDTKDAGEIGAGHTVTALYEIIPPSKLPKAETPAAKSLKYQPNVPSPAGAPATDAAALRKYGPTTASAPAPLVAGNAKNELLTIWLRYKQPDADKSDAEIEQILVDEGHAFAKASIDFRWAASVASFGMILRNSPHKGNATLDSVLELAQSALGLDKSGYREEFVSLVRSAKALQPRPTK